MLGWPNRIFGHSPCVAPLRDLGVDLLQILQGLERGLHEPGLPTVALESNHQLVRSAADLPHRALQAFGFFDQGNQAGGFGFSCPGGLAVSVAVVGRHRIGLIHTIDGFTHSNPPIWFGLAFAIGL